MNATLTLTKPRLLPSFLGLLASAALLTAGTNVQAAVTKEAAALNAKLAILYPGPPPATIGTATGPQLANAVFSFKTANPTNLDVGKIAGEALKGAGSNALDAGSQIAAKFAPLGTFPFQVGTKMITQDIFSVAAIKTAGSGTGPNLTQVPGFTAGLYTSDGAVNLAVSVKATKGAAGAVIQGGASLLGSDGAKEAYANTNIDPTSALGKKLASVVQDVAKGVAATVTDPVAFTHALVAAPNNLKILLKIIPGIAAGMPTAAGAITNAALTDPTYVSLGSKSPIIKGAAALAKSIGAVADIEQIEKVGAAFAAQIPVTTVQNGKTVPNIKLSAASGILSTLAKAIAAKPFASLIGGAGPSGLFNVTPAGGATLAALTKNSEKADELGELAAYFISALSTSAELTAANAGKTITGMIKAVIAGGKIATGKSGATPNKDDVTTYTALVANYVAGSVALTANNLPAGPVKTAILALFVPGYGKTIAGATNGPAVDMAIQVALGTNPTGRFENGFDVATGALTDPETNSRNF